MQSLENFAFRVTQWDEASLTLLGFGVAIIGFVLGIRSRRGSEVSLKRVPYLISSAGIVFAAAFLSLVWLGSAGAITNDRLWMILGTFLLGNSIWGFVIGMIAHARSVDAYGDGRSAWMAFVPIASLFLMFKPPMQRPSERSAIRFLMNLGGVALAVFLLALSAVVREATDNALDRATLDMEGDPELQQAFVRRMISAYGIAKALRLTSADVPTGRIDEITLLDRVVVEGRTLKYEYSVETNLEQMNPNWQRGLLLGNCETMAAFIEGGATIEHRYSRMDGLQIARVSASEETCASPPPIVGEIAPTTETSSVPDFETLIAGNPAEPMYRALQSYFPEEAEYFKTSLMETMETASSEREGFTKMYAVGAEIRRRHAENLRFAHDGTLSLLIDVQIQLLMPFEDDPMTCNRVVMDGVTVLSEAERNQVVAWIDTSTLLYRAMYEGETAPVQRSDATEEDWVKLITEFYAEGGTDAQLDLVFEPDIQDPKLCTAMIDFLRVAADASFEGADRMRAELVTAINKG